MNKYALLILLPFFLFPACDPGAETIIEIKNNTSFNLHITFSNDYLSRDIDVKENESNFLSLRSLGGFKDPNNEFIKIIFIDSDSEEVIKELILNEDDKLFEFIKAENHGKRIVNWKGFYIINIDNDLLIEH